MKKVPDFLRNQSLPTPYQEAREERFRHRPLIESME